MNKKKLEPGIFSIHFLVLMSYSSIAVLTLLPLFFEHLGGGPREIGLLIGVFSFAAFLCRPFSGWLLSRFHPKRVMIAGLLIILATTVLYLFVQRLNWFVVLLRIIHGIGFAIFVLAALLIAILITKKENRAYAIGVVSTAFMLPLLVIPYIAEEIIERFGFSSFFLAAVILAFIPLVFSLFAKINLPRGSRNTGTQSVGFFRLLGQKRILLIFLLTFIFEVGLGSSLSFIPLLAHGESPMRAGFYYTFLGLTAVFVRIFGGRQIKFWGSPKLVLPAFYLLSFGGILVYLSKNNVVLSLSGLIWGLGAGILYPHLTALVVEGVATQDKGMVLSLFASSVDLGFALGPIFFGWISQSMGLRNTFFLFSVMICLLSTFLIVWGRSLLPEKRFESYG
jgi:predicted MFS family arabinose efflux permease